MNKTATKSSFEDNLNALQTIVNKLENGDLSLDEALSEFESGVKLTKLAQKQLQNAEQKISILLSDNKDASLLAFTNSEPE